jgi:hypothetical protein
MKYEIEKKRDRPEDDQRRVNNARAMLSAAAAAVMLFVAIARGNECDDVNCVYEAGQGGMTVCNRPELCMPRSSSNPSGSNT